MITTTHNRILQERRTKLGFLAHVVIILMQAVKNFFYLHVYFIDILHPRINLWVISIVGHLLISRSAKLALKAILDMTELLNHAVFFEVSIESRNTVLHFITHKFFRCVLFFVYSRGGILGSVDMI